MKLLCISLSMGTLLSLCAMRQEEMGSVEAFKNLFERQSVDNCLQFYDLLVENKMLQYAGPICGKLEHSFSWYSSFTWWKRPIKEYIMAPVPEGHKQLFNDAWCHVRKAMADDESQLRVLWESYQQAVLGIPTDKQHSKPIVDMSREDNWVGSVWRLKKCNNCIRQTSKKFSKLSVSINQAEDD